MREREGVNCVNARHAHLQTPNSIPDLKELSLSLSKILFINFADLKLSLSTITTQSTNLHCRSKKTLFLKSPLNPPICRSKKHTLSIITTQSTKLCSI
ncbi:hypothetical protein Hanom_Chr14g01306471 [Helianthus anomalus]